MLKLVSVLRRAQWASQRFGVRGALAVAFLWVPCCAYAVESASGSSSDGRGTAGGGAQADFDTLIELITTTIEPTTWEEVGGTGTIQGFPGGVYVNPDGLLQQVPTEVSEQLKVWQRSLMDDDGNRDCRDQVPLRKVSLTRLDRALQRRHELGESPDSAMRYLAGLTQIRFLALLQRGVGQEDASEIILAGPAGGWAPGPHGQAVNVVDDSPVIPLDDLVVLLRNAYHQGGQFGCSITPRQQNLAETRAFLTRAAERPLRPGQRATWLAQIRERMGRQDISVHGIDPRTTVARLLVEADYHMKLIGMGLADGVPGVSSYLQRVEVDDRGQIPPLSVLRWWFTLDYDAILTAPGRDLFALRGPGVQVLSENEFLTRHGRRVHTGSSDAWNREFAHDFTRHFEALAAKYPCYARLRNIFDLAMVTALLRDEDFPGRTEGELSFLLGMEQETGPVYHVCLAASPSEVDSVINHRVIDRRHVVAGVSGGVIVSSGDVLERASLKSLEEGSTLLESVQLTIPEGLADDVWWWD